MDRWTKEKAWDWVRERPWIRGFNYVPADCKCWIDQWQEYEHEARFATVREELAVAKKIGFNAIRQFLTFEVWLCQHDTFMRYVEEFLSIAAENGLGVMFVLISDVGVPEKTPVLGKRDTDDGFHSFVKHQSIEIPGIFPYGDDVVLPPPDRTPCYSPIDEPAIAEKFCEYAGELARLYAKDERVIVWNLWNEPGNLNRGTMSVPLMKRVFEIFRSYDPIQPLCADVWRFPKTRPIAEEERIALELSDVISYHDYGSLDHSVRVIDFLRQFDRPMLNTEWLHRVQYNEVRTHLPLYYNNGIGVFNWGLVRGKFNGHEPWESCWRRYAAGEKLDLTKWQHDLLRPNYRPYDPEEIRTFQLYAGMADKAFASRFAGGDPE